MSVKPYLSIVRNSIINRLSFRMDFIFKTFGNFIYIILIFYLWKAIYNDPGKVLHGLSFPEAFTYLSVNGTIAILLQNSVDWFLSSSIIYGGIYMQLILPIDYHLYIISRSVGGFANHLVTVGISSFVFLIAIFHIAVPIGLNIALFALSLVIAVLISANIDFITGSLAFSAQSIWGIKIIKDTIILFLSGAVIPIQFFPESARAVLMALPFQSMFYTPANILLGKLTGISALGMILVQLFWLAALFITGRFFFNKLKSKLLINGG